MNTRTTPPLANPRRAARRWGALAAALLIPAVLALTGCAAATADEETVTMADGVELHDAWVKSAESGMSAAFGTVHNHGDVDAEIVAVSSAASTAMQLHETVTDSAGTSMMQEVTRFALPAGGELVLEPGGDHFMLMDLVEPLLAGDTATFVITFADGSELEFTAEVRDFTGAEEEYSGDMGDMEMGDDAADAEHDH